MEGLLPYEAPAPPLSFSQAQGIIQAYEASSKPIKRHLWCYEVFGGNHSITRAYGVNRLGIVVAIHFSKLA